MKDVVGSLQIHPFFNVGHFLSNVASIICDEILEKMG